MSPRSNRFGARPRVGGRRVGWGGAGGATAGLLLLLAVHLGGASTAVAGPLDVDLRRLGRFDGGTLALDQGAFDGLVRDLALLFAPRRHGPAATLGASGFAVMAEVGLARVDAGARHWAEGADDASNVLSTIGLHARKGLPFSVELGGGVTHLVRSSAFAVGADVAFSPLEGFAFLPDVTLSTHVRAVLGVQDLAMVTSGASLVISKGFALGGILSISPYAGYSFVYAHGAARATAFFAPTAGATPCDPSGPGCSRLGLHGDAELFLHRGVFGVSVLASVVRAGFEMAYAEAVQTYTFHVGVEF